MTVPDIRVKICGLNSHAGVAAAVAGGAAYVGFVFFEKSPRNLSLDLARDLAGAVPAGIAKVALCVNADDGFLDRLCDAVPLDMLQLHGGEPPERVAALKARFGLPVMKAIGVAGPDDLAQIDRFAPVADQLLIDAKPAPGAALPGGNGLAFDWALLKARKYWTRPWMLAGGLTPDNVAEAVRCTGARQVDVSSGVETAPGVKDPALIAAFLRAALGDTAVPPDLRG